MQVKFYSKPVHTHDCDRCVYLGTLSPHKEDEPPVDCYWCEKQGQDLTSIIGRYSSEPSDNSSMLIPERLIPDGSYINVASRWYLFALLRAIRKGLYKPT